MNIINYLSITSISVKNYCFYSNNFCSQNKAKFILNFTIYGYFLSTIEQDNIENTVNYYAFCLHIKNIILNYSCDKKNISSVIKPLIKSYSPLINNGYLTIKVLCHTQKIIKLKL